MREIIFRGKRVDNGEWVQGHYYGIWDKKYILWGEHNHIPEGCEVIPETVGQYTGIEDKNGKMIFEGDLVEWRVNGRMSIGDMFFYSGWFDMRNESGIVGFDPNRGLCMVIGNIHDRKEDV